MADKILYANKEKLLDDITIPNKNKVTADDMNEIKEVVNAHADDIDELYDVKANRTEIPTDLSQLSNATTKFVNETQLSEAIESEESSRELADKNLQGQIDSINDDISALDDRVETNEEDIADINLEQTVQDNEIGALKLDSGHTIELSINTTNYELSAKLKNKSGTILNTSTVDLPLESMIINVEYDNSNKQLIITLQNGNKIYVPIADIIGGLQSEITPENMLSSDLVDDNNHAHKFMSIGEKTKLEGIETGAEVNVIEVIKVDGTAITVTNKTVNIDLSAKEDNSNKVTEITDESTDIEYPSAKCVYDSQVEQDNEISVLRNLAETELEDATATGTSITVNDSANAPAKLLPSGNTYQENNIKTYECEGTETGDYYFTYNSINYQFTMPTISANSVLSFNTDTLKLYLGDTEISTTTDNTGTLITMADTPNPSYIQTIHNVSGHNEFLVQNKNWFSEALLANYLNGDYYEFTTAQIRATRFIDLLKTIKFSENTQYTFSCRGYFTNGVYAIVRFYYIDGTYSVASIPQTNEGTVTLTSEEGKTIDYVAIENHYNGTSKSTFIKKGTIQIEKGTTATPYVEHEEQTAELDLPEGMEMCKIDSYQDKFIKQNGKWYFEQNIIKRMLQELNYARNVQSSTGNIIFSVPTTYKGINADVCVLSSHFKGIRDTQGNKLNSIRVNSGHNCYIIVEDNEISETVITFKNWLQQNNVYAYFILNTPTLTEITDTTLISQLDAMQKIISYFEQTNVNTITAGDLEAILNLEYKKSNRLRIDALEQAIISLGGNV